MKIIDHLEDLYGPRPLLREAARTMSRPQIHEPIELNPDPTAANIREAAAPIAT